MTSEEQRAALAAHEALNRVADDVIVGRIGGASRHTNAPPVAPPQVVPAPEPEPAPQPAAEPYAPPVQHYVEPQSYQPYAPVAHAPELAAQPEPAPQQYAHEPYLAEQPAQDHQDQYAHPEQPAEQADPYGAAYTPEQQAAEQRAAEAYAAEFAASIAQTGVASAAEHAQQNAPQESSHAFMPEVAVAAAPVVAKRDRSGFLTWFFALIATIAIGVSLYQGYLFHRTTDTIEKNVTRTEITRTCRDIVGAYFEVKQKMSVLMPAADRGNIAGASRVTEANRLEAQAAITKFSGLSAYLANYQDVSAQVRYAELTRALNGIMDVARTTPLTDLDRVFGPADKIFSSLNDDCVKTSSALRN